MVRTILIIFMGFSVSAKAWTLIGRSLGGWDTTKLTLYVSSTSCPISQSTLYGYIDSAISVWNSVSTSGLQLTRSAIESSLTADDFIAGQGVGQPTIICDADFETHFGASSSSPGVTQVSAPAGRINRASIFLNAESGAFAAIDNLTASQLRITIAHELGHLLGLGHASPGQALMYYSISTKDDARLIQDDVMGFSYLYPRNEFTNGPFGCSSAHSSHGWPSGLLWSVLYFGLLLGLGRVLFKPAPLP